MKPLTVHAKLSQTNLFLGVAAVALGLLAAYIIFQVGYVDEKAVAILVGGLLLGGLVVWEALHTRHLIVRLTGEHICVGEECVPWEVVSKVEEKLITRSLKTWFGKITLRRLRHLEVYGATPYPLRISNEWLSAEDYAAVRAWLAEETAVQVSEVAEEG